MGTVCSASAKKKSNPIEVMIKRYNMNIILDQWPTSFISVLRQKFQAVGQMNQDEKQKKSKEGLDYQAFMKLFPRLKHQPEDISQRAFRLFDIDQSKRVDFREFCAVLALIIISEEQERMGFLFQLYDFDNDQALSKGEFKYLLKVNFSYLYLDVLNQENKKITKESDKNLVITMIINQLFEQNKRKLKFDEFRLWMDKHFDTIKYFEIFELVPGPLKEREIIRQIMKRSSEENTSLKQKYYVISFKWWELWRFYINYNFAQKSEVNDCVSRQHSNEENKLKNRISKRPSNVSLVDLDLANTIPSEMKEDHSVTRKIQKTNMLPIDQFQYHATPGKLMKNAKISNDSRRTQIERLSPTFKSEEQHPHHKHSNSQPNPAFLLELNPQIRSFHDLMEVSQSHSSKQFCQIQNKLADNDPDPVISYEQFPQQPQINRQNSPNENESVHLLDQESIKQEETQLTLNQDDHQGQQGEIRAQQQQQPQVDEVDDNIIEQQQQFQRQQSEQLPDNPDNQLAIDYQILKYGIYETEDNDQLSQQNQQSRIDQKDKNMQNLRPGQIDNSDLQGEYEGELKLNLMNNHDFVLVPEDAWFSLSQWYGYSNPQHVFKRRVFHDTKRSLAIVDLYPPVLNGYITDSKGEIIYEKKVTLMVSSRKSLLQCFLKFSKHFRLGKKHQNFIIFIKKIGDKWIEISNINSTLVDHQIDSGTFIVFVKKKRANQFILHNENSNVEYKLGDQFDVLHPKIVSNIKILFFQNEWKLCYICDLTKDSIKFHIKKESYQKEFFIKIDQLAFNVEPPGQRSSKNQAFRENEFLPYFQNLYPGLTNLGNTCFMNTVLQCLFYTPLFRDYLRNNAFRDDLVIKHRSKIAILRSLIEELANLMESHKPSELKKRIDIVLPQFSGYEQHDAQEFLSLFLDSISDELRKPNSSTVIEELFMGKTVNQLECMTCRNRNIKEEAFYTLSIPIPVSDEVSFEIIFVPRLSKNSMKSMKKFGIKVSKYCTLKDFLQQFEKVSGYNYNKEIEIAEVYRNAIHRTFHTIEPRTSLRLFMMKTDNDIYAYEILKQIKDIEDESNELMQMTNCLTKKVYKIDDFVDVQDNSGDWKQGQIKEIREHRYDSKLYRVLIRSDKSEMLLPYQQNQVMPFRSKTLGKKQAVLFNVVNRIYNPVTDNLENFAIPLIVTIPIWLTWKEFRILIYRQAKRFIDFSYVKKKKYQMQQLKKAPYKNNEFEENEEIRDSNQMIQKTYTIKDQQAQSVYLGEGYDYLREKQIKQSQMEVDYSSITPRMSQYDVKSPLLGGRTRPRNFSDTIISDEMDFLSSPDFPYRIRLLDQNKNCIQCDRYISYNKKYNNDKWCQGCELGMEDVPFMFNILNMNILISLDWIDSLAFNPFSTQADHDQSYVELIKEKKERRDRISHEQCFNLLCEEEKLEIQCDQCNSLQPARTKFMLSQTLPNILIIHLKRFQFRDGYYEKIENDVQFPLKSLNLKQWVYSEGSQPIMKSGGKEKDILYDLYAVANHMGNGQMGHYTSYIKVNHEGKDYWVNFDDDSTRPISEEKVLSPYSYLLFYKKKQFSSSAIINLTFKSFAQ